MDDGEQMDRVEPINPRGKRTCVTNLITTGGMVIETGDEPIEGNRGENRDRERNVIRWECRDVEGLDDAARPLTVAGMSEGLQAGLS